MRPLCHLSLCVIDFLYVTEAVTQHKFVALIKEYFKTSNFDEFKKKFDELSEMGLKINHGFFVDNETYNGKKYFILI